MSGVETVLDFEMVQNTDFRMNFTAYDYAGALLDLTGAVIKFGVMTKKGATPVVTKTSVAAAGITIKNQVTYKGQFYVDLVPTDTILIQGKYIHDESIVDSGGKASNLRNSDGTFGTILITPQFTAQ